MSVIMTLSAVEGTIRRDPALSMEAMFELQMSRELFTRIGPRPVPGIREELAAHEARGWVRWGGKRSARRWRVFNPAGAPQQLHSAGITFYFRRPGTFDLSDLTFTPPYRVYPDIPERTERWGDQQRYDDYVRSGSEEALVSTLPTLPPCDLVPREADEEAPGGRVKRILAEG